MCLFIDKLKYIIETIQGSSAVVVLILLLLVYMLFVYIFKHMYVNDFGSVSHC